MIFSSLLLALAASGVAAQELLHTLDFTGYNGSGIGANTPAMLNSSIWRVQTSLATKTSYGMASTQADFARGLVTFANRHSNNSFMAGGIGAVELSGNSSLHRALFLMQSSSSFSSGFVEFALKFDSTPTTTTSTLFEIDFDFWVLDRGTRSSQWQFGYALGSSAPNDSNIVELTEARVTTPVSNGSTPTWSQQKLKLAFSADVKSTDTHFYGRFTGLDNNGTGTRDVVAIDSINVLGYACQPGTLFCPCLNNSCNSTLSCVSGTCRQNCAPMSLGCACGAGDACDAGLSCTSNVTSSRVCTVGGCRPGEPGCICTPLNLCDSTSCVAGMCQSVTCPSMASLLAQCNSTCAATSVKVCACQGGTINIQCNNATTTTNATATSSPVSTTTMTTVAGGTTAVGNNDTATTAETAMTTTMSSSSSSSTTTGATPAPTDCSKLICANCITNSDCLWCGNSRMGICYGASSGSSCSFQPVTQVADCPATIIPTTLQTTATEPPMTSSEQTTAPPMTLSGGRVELAASVAALAAAVVALRAAQ